jgi:hypothetical protein
VVLEVLAVLAVLAAILNPHPAPLVLLVVLADQPFWSNLLELQLTCFQAPPSQVVAVLVVAVDRVE